MIVKIFRRELVAWKVMRITEECERREGGAMKSRNKGRKYIWGEIEREEEIITLVDSTKTNAGKFLYSSFALLKTSWFS